MQTRLRKLAIIVSIAVTAIVFSQNLFAQTQRNPVLEYCTVPNAVVANLSGRKHLGIHTELISDGIVYLMKQGIGDNSRKTVNRGKTVATFCMGKRSTYEYLHVNPSIDFRAIDYANNPLLIARQDNMVGINSALEIDLTGQATAESIGKTFYSGVGGQADFMRGAALARNGKTILKIQSTAVCDVLEDCPIPQGGGRGHGPAW